MAAKKVLAGLCDDFVTFGTCWRGSDQCQRRHNGDTWSSNYFVGVIDKIIDKQYRIKRCDAEKSTETYFVDGRKWSRQDTEPGHLVVFQSSEREHNNLKYGRVVLILGTDETQRVFRRDAEVEPEIEAFTLYPEEVPAYWDAFSIFGCRTHGNKCQRIGVHIPALAWCLNERITSLPPKSRHQLLMVNKILEQGKTGLAKFGAIDTGKPVLAISVYIHSKPAELEGPMLTPVKIVQNYTFDEYRERHEADMKLLCSVFQTQRPGNILNGKHYWHLTLEKDKYMLHIVVDEALTAQTLQMTKYFRQHIGEHCVVQFWQKLPPKRKFRKLVDGRESVENSDKDYFVLEEHLKKAREVGSSIEAAKWLASSLQIMTFRESLYETSMISKRLGDVKQKNDIKGSHFTCVFAQKSLPSIVNQQILINSMLGEPTVLYEKADLLGILVHRFHAPALMKALIIKLDEDFLVLNYIELSGTDLNLTKIPYGEMGLCATKDDDGSEGEYKLTWEDFTCEEVEYDKVFRVDATEVGKCFSSLRQTKVPSEPLDQMARSELPPPFEISTSRQLKFTVVPGMIVRMQLCNFNPEHRTQVGLRMLRVGKNGHICLAHMNCPQKVFATDREDLRGFATGEPLSKLKRIGKLYPAESRRVITWSGRYNAGGQFRTDRDVKKGDLLCIRKDVYDGDRVEYVWNAHAFVTEDKAENGEVSFSVCSLLQPGEMEDSDNFVVEHIDLLRE